MGISFSNACEQALIACWGCFCSDGNYIHMMDTNLEALEKSMKELEDKRDDLLTRVYIEEDNGLQPLAQVKGWFRRVEDVGPQVNDLLEDKANETGRLCLLEYCSTNCKSSYDYGERVSKKLKEVEGLLSKNFVNVADKIPARKVEKKNNQATVGMDAILNDAWDRLMKGGRRILGLYGMGGVGKTTLLECINDKFIPVEKEFDIVIFAVVSKYFRNGDLQDKILGRLRLDKEWKQATEEEKASLIYNNLEKKKFILLLDDLWSEVDLNKVGVPPVTQENGSKIIFTTRAKEVCKNMEADDMMEVVCLSPEKAWELFQMKVEANPLMSDPSFHPVARQVAQKCCGFPLTLCVIGKTMACKETEEEWDYAIYVLNSYSLKFPNMEEKVLSILKFSYDSLKDVKIRLCFLYCSLFPENHTMKKEMLIQYWICEGFIDGNGSKDGVYNQGHDIIGSLLHLQLLTEGFLSTTVRLHEMMRQMALWIASSFGKREELQYVQSGAQLRQIPNDINWENVTVISLMRNQIDEIHVSSKCPNLSTLFLHNNRFVHIPGEFFRYMTKLRVLNLSMNFLLSGLPEEISNLVSLQYLNLSLTGIRCLPEGLKKLKKLINLNLEATFDLCNIAGIATSLPQLQELRFMLSGVCIDNSLLEELHSMKDLNLLTANIEDAMILINIQRVGRLASILRGLCLRNMAVPFIVLSTMALPNLQRLEILTSIIPEIIVVCEKNSQGFKHLSRVHVVGLAGSKNLTWLLFAQNLTYLLVSYSREVEEIIDEEERLTFSVLPDLLVPFGKLEFFSVNHMDNLKRICLNPPALPNLKQFDVISCSQLPDVAIEFPGTPSATYNVQG